MRAARSVEHSRRFRAALPREHDEVDGGCVAGDRREQAVNLAAMVRLVIEEIVDRGAELLLDRPLDRELQRPAGSSRRLPNRGCTPAESGAASASGLFGSFVRLASCAGCNGTSTSPASSG